MKLLNSTRRLSGRFLTALGLTLMVTATARADYQSTVLGDKPIAYYALDLTVDNNGTATDLTGNGNDSPYYNIYPTAGPTPYIPNAAIFGGIAVESYVDLSQATNAGILNFGGPITMEGWVQSTNTTQGPADVIGKGYDGTTGDELCLRANGGVNYYGGTYNFNNGGANASGGQQTTNWTYLAATYDGTNWNLYVNSQLVGTGADTVGAIDFADPWAIGTGSSSGANRFFQGNICQVALYTNALTPNQVYAHYFAGQYGVSPSNSLPIIKAQPAPQISFAGGNATFNVTVLSILPTTNQWYKGSTPIIGATNTTLVLTNVQSGDAVDYYVAVGNSNGVTNSSTASLTLSISAPTLYESTVLSDQPIAYCPLEPGVDTTNTAYDWSGNGNNGTYNNSSSYNSGNSPAPHISNSANFNGSLSANLGGGPNAGLLNFGGKITLEAWVQPSNVTGTLQDILAKGYDASTYNETVLRQDSGTYTGNGGSGDVAQVGTWAYVVSANDGTNWNLYVNGLLVKQSTSSSGAENFSDPWGIGSGTSGGSSRYLTGNLSQVALYNYGLSANQVAVHYLIAESGATNVRPVIATQPLPQNGFVGGNAVFSVGALSLSATTNQWFWNGSALAGQTNATLTLTNLSLASVGGYSVVVGNIYGTTNSASATLAVTVPNNLAWSANNNSGVWDTTNSANWINLTTSAQTVFNTGDAVTFDDTVGVPTTVTLGVGSTVQPSLITVNSSVNNFSIERASDGSGLLNGSGSLIKKGTSTLTINSGGTLTGTATIAGGLVYAGNNSFANLSGITITNASTMDIGGGSFNTPLPVTISDSGFNGQGAIINSYGDYPTAAFKINLAGDATISPSPQRWDLVSGSVSGAHILTVNGNGGYSMEWNSLTIGAEVSTIIFTNGDFGMKYLDNAFQNPATVCIVGSNSQFDFWNGGFNGSLDLLSGAEINIYSGEPLTIGSGATLSSISSTVTGDLVGGFGSTIAPSGASPGVATGVLIVSGNFTNNGTIDINLDGSGINDSIICSNDITYGGTLNLINISGSPLAAGDSFHVFNAVTYTGSFNSITPTTPGAGLIWDKSQLGSGIINVISGSLPPVISTTTLSGGNLIFSGTGGAPNGTYYVLASTNLLAPLNTWTVVSTNQFSATGTFGVTNAVAPGMPQRFYIIK